MKVCGVEIKSNDAIICLMSYENDLFQLPDCRTTKLVLSDIQSAEGIRAFQFAFAKLAEDYQIERVAIKERPMKGKFAGGAAGFKIESAIQLIKDLNVTLISSTAMKETLKRHPMPIDFKATGLRNFQEAAFTTAYCYVMANRRSETQ